MPKIKASEMPIDDFVLQNLEFVFDLKLKKNFVQRLRRRGFVKSIHGHAYYHPKHWKNASGLFGKKDPGDTWYEQDAFKAISKEAKKWIKEDK